MYRKYFLHNQISRGVWIVSIAMMMVSISAAMMFSISPFFVTEVLGLSLVSLGWIDGAAEGLSQFLKLVSGYTGDYFKKKKPPLVIGVILATISKPVFILANGQFMIVMAKVIERISNGVMATPRDAYCAEESKESARGASLGLMMSLKTLGVTVGSLIIGGLMYYTNNYILLLWIGFIPCCLSLFLLVKYMKENSTSKKTHQAKVNKINWHDVTNLSSRYWSIVCTATIFMCARFSEGFIMLRMSELGVHKSICGMTIGMFNLVSVFACLPIGYISDKFDRSRMLYIVFLALIGANICFMYADGLPLLLVGIVLWGLQRGPSQMLFAAIIADEVPKKIIGTALGIYYVATGVASFVAGGFAGKFAAISLQYTFVFGFGTAMLSLIVLALRNKILPSKVSLK